jgi:hypothetical protein
MVSSQPQKMLRKGYLYRFKSAALSLLIFFTAFVGYVFAWPVPDTGQTKCYNNTGVIPCPSEGQDFYGQDGSYTINPPSYTKLDANGNDLADNAPSWVMVRDNVAGLVWEIKNNKNGVKNYSNPNDADNTYTWYDSNPATNGGNAGTSGTDTDTEDFISALNAAHFGGYDDWRMPTIKELSSLVNSGIPNPGPSIDTAWFPKSVSSSYWSSTTDAYYRPYAKYVSFNLGSVSDYHKSYSCYVRAVRGGQAESTLIDNGDGTVSDTATGLMWEKATEPETYTWANALSRCENLVFPETDGYSDWRLPNRNELQTLVDYSRNNPPAIDPLLVPSSVSSSYWSSTTFAYSTDLAWYMNFSYGGDGNDYKSYGGYVRAVRGGQSGLLDHLIISIPSQASIWQVGMTMPIIWNTSDLGGNVEISLSRDGGKTFEFIVASTPNDGSFAWTVSGAGSVNCALKITPLVDPLKFTTQSLFTIDNCPNDPDKLDPGVCGCGTPDVDSDSDGTADCHDLCPADPDKIDPGQCGCGIDDTDKDSDGTADCNDNCPNDSFKTDPGACGCGIPDTDRDSDGTADCVDGCPDDPLKTIPGPCGCGAKDTDTDSDGVPDCLDSCPDDPSKTTPGVCGCGTPDSDTDSDGAMDCNDACPTDPNKTQQGVCGCHVPDVDADSDGIYTCQGDQCDSNPDKTEPGLCGCDQADTDTDSDGMPDCLDDCENDPLKVEPGICGCGVADADKDSDGVQDCIDGCPDDPNKTESGICGCGIADTDTDGDKIPDCHDAFPDIHISKGDLNNNGQIDLIDGVLAVQLMAGSKPASVVFKEADVNADGKIGLEEVVFILRNISGG